MSIENPNFDETEKSEEQYFEDIVGQSPQDFIASVVSQMKRFQNKKTFILNESVHLLPKSEEVDQDMKKVMDILSSQIDRYLDNN